MAQLPPGDPYASLQGQQILSIRTSSNAPPVRTELPRRRQNRSCDQCRKGKRACDAAILGKTRPAESGDGSSSTSSASPDAGIPAIGPCSNCRRWRKECTFKWLNSVQTKSAKRRRKSEAAQDRAGCEPTTAPLSGSNPQVMNTHLGPPTSGATGYKNPTLWKQDPLTKLLQGQDSSDSSELSGSKGPDSVEDDISGWDTDVIGFAVRNDEPVQDEQTLGGFHDPNSLQSYPPNHRFSETNDQARHYALQSESRDYRKHISPAKTARELLLRSENLSHSVARSAVTQNLLRIYRDSMENALSCWLTERTCPYSGPLTLGGKQPEAPPQFSIKNEWGPNWSNRICTRVCRLDRSYSMIRGRSLTPAEEKAASRALHTSIMAFATQWTQTGRPPSLIAGDGGPGSSTSSKGLERSIQESCWNQAYKALNDSVGIESFRVVFAHIIFSLTLRPLNVRQHLEAMNARRCSNCKQKRDTRGYQLSEEEQTTGCSCDLSADLFELSEILDSDKAPLFLETAVRQMYAYRHKLAGVQRRGLVNQQKNETTSAMGSFAQFALPEKRTSIGGPSQQSSTMVLSPSDYETFNLLFWLGIMFDTLSAVMYQRPPVVSDEDSDVTTAIPEEQAQSTALEKEIDLNGWNMLSVYSDAGKRGRDIWGDFFLDKRPVTRWKNITSWPCSYEEAAEVLSDATPVKVLIYRRLTRLQTLIYRGAPSDQLEEAVQESLRVYQYWNHTYGNFMMGCVTHHESLPPRVQSWYILLAAHWHLAPILMADILEGMDNAGLSIDEERESRRVTHFVSALRKENAFAVADLARCSSHGKDPSFAKGAEFHDAVNAQAFLTEPWTAVLIRSFARAGYILLDGVCAPHVGEEPPNIYLSQPGMLEESRRRCQMCIDALWWIGRKSDMAFLAARALSDSYDARLRGARRSTRSAEISEIPFPEVEVPDLHGDGYSRDDILYPLVGSIAG